MYPYVPTEKYFEEHPDRKVLEDLTQRFQDFTTPVRAEEAPRLVDFSRHLAKTLKIDRTVILIDADPKEHPSI